MSEEDLGEAYARSTFWKALIEYEPGAWVVTAVASFGVGALRWHEHESWLHGAYAGSMAFVSAGVALLVAGFIVHRKQDAAWRRYMRMRHGPGSEW